MKNLSVAALLSASLMGSALTHAELDTSKAYVAAGIQLTDLSLSARATGIGFLFGIPNKNNTGKTSSSVEFGYTSFGTAEDVIEGTGGVMLEASGSSLFAAFKGAYKINNTASLTGRIGLNRITIEAEAGGFSAEETEMRLLYSFGADFMVTPLISITTSYTALAADVDSIGAQISYSF